MAGYKSDTVNLSLSKMQLMANITHRGQIYRSLSVNQTNILNYTISNYIQIVYYV